MDSRSHKTPQTRFYTHSHTAQDVCVPVFLPLRKNDDEFTLSRLDEGNMIKEGKDPLLTRSHSSQLIKALH